jgi:MoaA/NifB/PqqE/SkfB family radical SAM enzyme
VFQVSRRLRHTFDIEVGATTNGTTLHLARVQSGILECFSELTVSVDGFADFHENLRGWPDGWQRLREAVRALAQARTAAGAKLKLRANIVIMRDNLPMFADLCQALAEWGLDEITFNQLGGRDRPEFFPAHGLRPKDTPALSALVATLRAKLADRGVRLCGSKQYLERIEASAHGRSRAVTDCSPGERFLFIDERGRIAPCSFTPGDFGVPLEAVRTVDDLLHLPTSFAAARVRKPGATCGDCPSNQVFAKFAV